MCEGDGEDRGGTGGLEGGDGGREGSAGSGNVVEHNIGNRGARRARCAKRALHSFHPCGTREGYLRACFARTHKESMFYGYTKFFARPPRRLFSLVKASLPATFRTKGDREQPAISKAVKTVVVTQVLNKCCS